MKKYNIRFILLLLSISFLNAGESNILDLINKANNIKFENPDKKTNENNEKGYKLNNDKYLEIPKEIIEKQKEEEKLKEQLSGLEKLKRKFDYFKENYANNPLFIDFNKKYFDYLKEIYKPPYIEAKKTVTYMDEEKLKKEAIKNIEKAQKYYYYYYYVFNPLPNFFNFSAQKIAKLPTVLKVAFEIKDTELYLNFFKYMVKDPIFFDKKYGKYARNLLDKYYSFLEPFIKYFKIQEEQFKKYMQNTNFVNKYLINYYVLSNFFIYYRNVPSNLKQIALTNIKYTNLLLYTKNIQYIKYIKNNSNILWLYLRKNPYLYIKYEAFYKLYKNQFYQYLISKIKY